MSGPFVGLRNFLETQGRERTRCKRAAARRNFYECLDRCDTAHTGKGASPGKPLFGNIFKWNVAAVVRRQVVVVFAQAQFLKKFRILGQ